MRVTKEVVTTHPTVQYGNVDILSRYEWDSETDLLTKEHRARINKVDAWLTKTVCKSWSNLHDHVEDMLKPKLGRIENAGKRTDKEPTTKDKRNYTALRRKIRSKRVNRNR